MRTLSHIISAAIFMMAIMCSAALRAQETYPAIKGPVSMFDYIMSTNRISSGGTIAKLSKTAVSVDPICPINYASNPSGRHFYISDDYDFVKSLVAGNLKADAVNLVFTQDLYNPSDTLGFLRGFTALGAAQLDTASAYFSAVPESSGLYAPAVFYNVATLGHLGRIREAKDLISGFQAPPGCEEIKALQTAGICLVENDFEGYSAASSAFTHAGLNPYESALQGVFEQKVHHKSKSPLAAAAMSAVIPGAGKIYAGDLHSGVSAFLIVGSSAAFTAESWIKRGATNWRTCLLASLTGLFYLGNIYGSYMSVSVIENSITQTQNATILFNIHIPLYDLFN